MSLSSPLPALATAHEAIRLRSDCFRLRPDLERRPFVVPARFHRLTAEELRGAYGRELERWPWVHFGTLTSKRPMSEERADEVWRRFVREVWRRQGQGKRFHFVRVKEPFETRPGVHIHFLSLATERFLSEVERNSLSSWSQRKLGRLQLLQYDKRRGARDYLCKYVTCYGGDKFDLRFSPEVHRFRGPVVPELAEPERKLEDSVRFIHGLQEDKRGRLRAYLQRVEAEGRAGFITWRETAEGFIRVTTPNPSGTAVQPEASDNPTRLI